MTSEPNSLVIFFMMKKFLSFFLCFFVTIAWAQNVDSLEVSPQEEAEQVPENVELVASSEPTAPAGLLFGYFNYDEVLRFMPEYKNVKDNLEKLSNQFKAEADRAEAEFNKKYEAFLDEQRDLAPSIMKKRQAELQDMLERNIAFKEESQRLISEAEMEGFAPLKAKISEVLNKVGKEQGLAFILNTDNNAVPYINASVGVDISMLIKRELLGGGRRR